MITTYHFKLEKDYLTKFSSYFQNLFLTKNRPFKFLKYRKKIPILVS